MKIITTGGPDIVIIYNNNTGGGMCYNKWYTRILGSGD